MAVAQRPLETGWLSDTPVADSVLRRFLFNQADFDDLVAITRGGRRARTGEVAMSDAGPVSPFLNMAVLLRPLTGPDDDVIDTIEAFYGAPRARRAHVVLSAWPTPDLVPRGWELVGHPMFVARSPHPVGADPMTDGVEVTTVTDRTLLARYEQVLIDGYPMGPADDGLPMFGEGLIESSATLRIALVDGVPASVAASHVAHGVVNLCSAATLPAVRRRGAWRALVHARLSEGEGLPAVAFTSDFSRPGFVAMGFLPVTRFTLWLRRPS